MKIPLSLGIGDAISFPADLAIIGPSPALKRRTEGASGAHFEKFGVTSEILKANASVWKHTLALRWDSGKKVRIVSQRENQDALAIAIHEIRPKQVVFVPFSHRDPDIVALNMLFHIWLLYSVDRRWDFGRAGVDGIREIKIVDQADISCFERLLADNTDKLEQYCRTEFARMKGFGDQVSDFRLAIRK